jgi:hypothetical protein
MFREVNRCYWSAFVFVKLLVTSLKVLPQVSARAVVTTLPGLTALDGLGPTRACRVLSVYPNTRDPVAV